MRNMTKFMKGEIGMEGAKKLFAGYTMSASKGIQGRYDYSESKVEGFEQSGKYYFLIQIDSKRGREKKQTTDLTELLDAMKAYAPAKEWKLVKKEK